MMVQLWALAAASVRPSGGRSRLSRKRDAVRSTALLGPRPSLVLLSAHTEGYDGERLAALSREHLGAPSSGADLRLIARSGNVLRLGGWARTPAR